MNTTKIKTEPTIDHNAGKEGFSPFVMPTLHRESVILAEDCVKILDRRVFPFEKRFEVCKTVGEVADAIASMVTQSNGPFYAAGAAMVLSARLAESLAPAHRIKMLEDDAARLVKTRPTNNNISSAVAFAVRFAKESVDNNGFALEIENAVRADWTARREALATVGQYAASLIQDGDRVMTYCWSEGAIMETMASALRSNKRITLICPETRPYLQGSRLTAHSALEMGIDAVVITDGMCAHAMAVGRANILMTAADRVTASGHVINKVGTLNAAIAARHFGVPYFATVLEPDLAALRPEDVCMEERDPEEVLHSLGHRTASPLAKGWYPAFDVTPPELVSAIVTRHGIFAPRALRQCLPRTEMPTED